MPQKFGDLIDLYQGKRMHSKALKMLHEYRHQSPETSIVADAACRLAKEEEDRLDRYPPTVRYLQKLGPAELPLILDRSKWIFEEDPKMALQVCLSCTYTDKAEAAKDLHRR